MSANNLFVKSGYVKAPLANGVGRFIVQCQRITIKFCKSNGDSGGVREFIEYDLVNFARNNPSIVTYLKPRRHRSPVLIAEYLNGHREWMTIASMGREELNRWLEVIRTSAGNQDMRLKQYHRTETPSIQGVWSPFTHTAPEKNIAVFPNEEYSRIPNRKKSATEILLEIQQGTSPVFSPPKENP